jgi:hypothetical protein
VVTPATLRALALQLGRLLGLRARGKKSARPLPRAHLAALLGVSLRTLGYYLSGKVAIPKSRARVVLRLQARVNASGSDPAKQKALAARVRKSLARPVKARRGEAGYSRNSQRPSRYEKS